MPATRQAPSPCARTDSRIRPASSPDRAPSGSPPRAQTLPRAPLHPGPAAPTLLVAAAHALALLTTRAVASAGLLSAAVLTQAAAQGPPGMRADMMKQMAQTTMQLYSECAGVPIDLAFDAFFETRGEPRNPTKDEQTRKEVAMKEIQKRVPKKTHQECMGQAQMQATMAGASNVMERTMAHAMGAGAGKGRTEAAGKDFELAEDLEGELRAGKTVIRHIDWVAMSAELSEAGRGAFEEAMQVLGAALGTVGGPFRVDFFMDQRYDDDGAAEVARNRLQIIQMHVGEAARQLELGAVTRDKNPRIEVARAR